MVHMGVAHRKRAVRRAHSTKANIVTAANVTLKQNSGDCGTCCSAGGVCALTLQQSAAR